MLEDIDQESPADGQARELVRGLLNLLEEVMADLRAAEVEIQRLRDENNRLKGEQGQPKIKPNKPPESTDHSSEKKRRKPKEWSKGSKADNIAIGREQLVEIDRDSLPPDAQFKGYEDIVVQDVIFRTDNVSYSTKRSSTPRHSTRPTWHLCHRATAASSVLGSKLWSWYSTSGPR